jgi:hypothetical protein
MAKQDLLLSTSLPHARDDLSPEEAVIRDDEPAAYNIGGWCRAHSVSYQFYQKMKRLGVGPVESVVAGKPFITREASREWRAAAAKRTAED